MIRHRGPDWNGIHCDKNCVIAHERLAIVGVNTGAQDGFELSLSDHHLIGLNKDIYLIG